MQKEDNRFSFKTIWSIIMSCAYLCIAYLVTFTSYILPYNSEEGNDDFVIVRIILGGALFLYAIFRAYGVIKSKK